MAHQSADSRDAIPRSGWVTVGQAATVLGIYPSTVGKLRKRGLLTSRGRHSQPSYDAEEVWQLAERREVEQAAAANARVLAEARRSRRASPQPPDQEHEWLSVRETAGLFKMTHQAMSHRAKKGLTPATHHDGRWWFRRDLIDLQIRARAMKRARSSR